MWACSNAVSGESVELVVTNEASTAWLREDPPWWWPMALTLLPAAGEEAGKDSAVRSQCDDSAGSSRGTYYLVPCNVVTHSLDFLPDIFLLSYSTPERFWSQLPKDSYTLGGLIKKAEPQGRTDFNS